jgi:hypothetical protein
MSKSQSNTPYNVKSMNGIITLSDGAGTTIENGEVTTNSIDANGKIKAIQIEANEVLFNDNLDMNNNNILQVNNMNVTTINSSAYPPATADTLSAVLALGNSAGSNNIDMNSQDLQNVDELQVDNITGRNGGANQIKMNSDVDMASNAFQNVVGLNFSAGTAGIFNNNNIQLQAGTAGTAGDFDVVLGHSTSIMNITGGDLDMNTNNILNCTNINTTTINGSAPAAALPKFFIGAFPYNTTNTYQNLAHTFFGSATGTGTANMYYVLNDPSTGAGSVGTARRMCWTNDPTYKMKVCRLTSATNRVGTVLTPGLWNIKFNIGETGITNTNQFPIQFFVDNNNDGGFADPAGGNRLEQQKTRYRTVRGAGYYHAVPAMNWVVYIGNPNIPETNSGTAKILAIESSIDILDGYGGWLLECTQLEAYSWNGSYNGWTPSTAANSLDTVGSWTVRNLNT